MTKSNKQMDFDSRHKQFLDAGKKLAKGDDFSKVTAAGIARACNCTAPLVFAHFRDRDVLREAVRQYIKTGKTGIAPKVKIVTKPKVKIAVVKAIKTKAAAKKPVVKVAAAKKAVAVKKAKVAVKKAKVAKPAPKKAAPKPTKSKAPAPKKAAPKPLKVVPVAQRLAVPPAPTVVVG